MLKRKMQLPKAPTGIRGLDEVTGGGLPRGRPTLICGEAGCGKTLLALEFIVRGATEFGEPGVFMAFEETAKDLAQNAASLGFDLEGLAARRKLVLDYVYIERSEIEETGEYDLEGLFVRLGHAIDSIGAKRVALDTLESLFTGLQNPHILRAELRRLFRWLKNRGVTAVITGERGEGRLTRQGLEEYISDCVIVLDHRVTNELSSRRMRIAKYRGTTHGTNEYPFLIDEDGISVVPITSLGLRHAAPTARLSSGIARLDAMLGGKGYYRGSSVLVSGTAGSGKSSVAAHFVEAACRRGERTLYLAFEESPAQIMRNMRSIGIDLAPWVKKGVLEFQAERPTLCGLEAHLARIQKAVQRFRPRVVIVDPLNTFVGASGANEVKAMLVRIVDFMKGLGVTSLFTSLTSGGDALEHTNVAISSLIDTWLLLRDIESGGERNRALHLLKSRGMAHSNQVREFLLTDRGVQLLDVYVGSDGVLVGSARLAQEARERAEMLAREQEIARKRHELEQFIAQARSREAQIDQDRLEMGRSRKADVNGSTKKRASR